MRFDKSKRYDCTRENVTLSTTLEDDASTWTFPATRMASAAYQAKGVAGRAVTRKTHLDMRLRG
uniref:Uncharacterized protein n=1 Tax=Hyaloperonospora arabidopsidis (strain Emoy2) TaxID=559515 RepID=M4BD05_HYAAE